MNTQALIDLIMEYPMPGEWLKVTGTRKRETVTHWFKSSRKGGTVIFHKMSIQGEVEGFSQPQMLTFFKGTDWRMGGG